MERRNSSNDGPHKSFFSRLRAFMKHRSETALGPIIANDRETRAANIAKWQARGLFDLQDSPSRAADVASRSESDFIERTACYLCLIAASEIRDKIFFRHDWCHLYSSYCLDTSKQPYCCLLRALTEELDVGRHFAVDDFVVYAGSCLFPKSATRRAVLDTISPSIRNPNNSEFHTIPLGNSILEPDRLVLEVERVDHTWIRSCLTECQRDHGVCRKQNTEHAPINIILIDVQSRCLVHRRKYFTLSYVWGKSNQFRTTKHNLAGLQEPGSLDTVAHLIPRTIIDAFELVTRIGGKYLWADVLCIVQDDGLQKQAQIAQMSTLYASACMTIIAVAGETADYGLPGVSPRSPSKEWREVASHVYLAPRSHHISKSLEGTNYFSRAWTYQEQVLSRRRLYFTKDSVYLECASEIRREDSTKPAPFTRDAVKLNPLALLPSYGPMAASGKWHKVFAYYAKFVHDYTPKDLSFQVDSVNAISGILNALCSTVGLTFQEGLPMHLLDLGLLWISTSDRERGDSSLPSWSWAGWCGASHYGLVSGRDVQSMLASVRLYIHARAQLLDLQNRVREITSTESIPPPRRVPTLTSDFGVALPPTVPGNCSVLAFLALCMPVHHFKLGTPGVLKFDRGAADGHFNAGITKTDTPAEYVTIDDHQGATCGLLFGCDLPRNILRLSSHRFVALSRSRAGDHFGPLSIVGGTWSLINILLVAQKGDYYERVTLGQVIAQQWEDANPVLAEIKLS